MKLVSTKKVKKKVKSSTKQSILGSLMAHSKPGFHSVSNLDCSYTDTPGLDTSPSQVPSQQCWYSFAAEYTEAKWGK